VEEPLGGVVVGIADPGTGVGVPFGLDGVPGYAGVGFGDVLGTELGTVLGYVPGYGFSVPGYGFSIVPYGFCAGGTSLGTIPGVGVIPGVVIGFAGLSEGEIFGLTGVSTALGLGRPGTPGAVGVCGV